jgi:hypothetical protein
VRVTPPNQPNTEAAEFFVPVALTNLEAIAVKSACVVVATSIPGLYSPDHPLMTAALKVERDWREARDKALADA